MPVKFPSPVIAFRLSSHRHDCASSRHSRVGWICGRYRHQAFRRAKPTQIIVPVHDVIEITLRHEGDYAYLRASSNPNFSHDEEFGFTGSSRRGCICTLPPSPL